MTTMGSIVPHVLLTTLALGVTAPIGTGMWKHYETAPLTRDVRVRADLIAVAPDVSGLVDEVLIQDNQVVRKGDLMLRLDPERFLLAVWQAEAALASREVAVEKAESDPIRHDKLTEGVVSQQQRETIRATDLQAEAANRQAVADLDIADLDIAHSNLDRSKIRSPVNGRMTNFDLRPGAYVTAGCGIMALIDTDRREPSLCATCATSPARCATSHDAGLRLQTFSVTLPVTSRKRPDRVMTSRYPSLGGARTEEER